MARTPITDDELDRLLVASNPTPPGDRAELSMQAIAVRDRIMAGESAGVRPRQWWRMPRLNLVWVAPVTAVLLVGVIVVGLQSLLGGVAQEPRIAGTPTAAAPSPSPSADSEGEPTLTAGEPVSGVGYTDGFGAPFPIAAGARSLILEFTCEGDASFVVEIGTRNIYDTSPQVGICGQPHKFLWPVTENTYPEISVSVAGDVEWTATPTFSTAPFEQDLVLAVECDAYTEIHSALLSADAGVTWAEAIDEAEWHRRVADATAQLDALMAGSLTILAEPLARVSAEVAARSSLVGELSMGRELADAAAPIHEACRVNHSGIMSNMEFGG